MNSTNPPDWTGYSDQMSPLSRDIWYIQYTSYMILLPILIAVGWIVSSISFFVLRRTKLRATHVNTYFLLLAGADFFVFTVSIPTIKSLNGCNLRSHAYALYFVHVFFTIFYIIQTISLYLILWIAYDRFLAIWNFSRFNEIQKPSVIRMRLTCTIIICVLLHLEHLFNVKVTCSNVPNCKPGNSTCETIARLMIAENTCKDGIWIINDGLHYITEKPIWRQIYWALYGLLVSAIPIILVVLLNLGIVVAIIIQRVRSVSSTARTQRRDLSRIYIILAISLTFICCTAPTLIHATFYANNIDNCHGPYSEEIFRAVAHLLLLVEHITHFIILIFNEVFWQELKKVVALARQYTKNFLWRLTGHADLAENSVDTGTNSPAEVPAVEPMPTAPLPTISVVTGQEESNKDEVTINSASRVLRFHKSTKNDTEESSNSLRPPERSPTASMVTLEEIII
ncbi:FMRFamide peptide receptor frpr-18-like [Palaemon carinicauda]|uniref:FMRFamide peptide receptor frpr-18-like n=1 Tax=Palaemon carinicauda TaxID=392227 RepID=UPI0035B5D982